MTTVRDPITCHVLDTTTGRPGAKIRVDLVCLSQASIVFTALTNGDGRIVRWENKQGPGGSQDGAVVSKGGVTEMIRYLIKSEASGPAGSLPEGNSLWKVDFNTGDYYGIANTFFPKVELTFLAKEGEHFHVPLLLGPYSFTTYRGS